MVQSAEDGSTAERATPPSWLRNAAVWVGVGLALAVLVVLGVALLPGWWASTIGGWVRGVEDRGALLGVVIGATFTLLPLAVGLVALRSGLSSRWRVGLIVTALLLLLPNVLTIAVALGSSDARSVIAIEAPSFRGATGVGIGLTVVVLLAVVVIRWWSRRTRRTVEGARERAVVVGRERAAERAAAEGTTASMDDPAEGQGLTRSGDNGPVVVDPAMSLTDPDRPVPTETGSVDDPDRPA